MKLIRESIFKTLIVYRVFKKPVGELKHSYIVIYKVLMKPKGKCLKHSFIVIYKVLLKPIRGK